MEEKRRHKRVYFSIDEDFLVEIDAGGSSCNGRLLSLSEGGLSFFVSIDESPEFKKEDLIFLSSLKSKDAILVDSLVFLSVRYAIEDEEAGKVIVGCKFLDLDKDAKEKIKDLVEQKTGEFTI